MCPQMEDIVFVVCMCVGIYGVCMGWVSLFIYVWVSGLLCMCVRIVHYRYGRVAWMISYGRVGVCV